MCSEEILFFDEESIDRERVVTDEHRILNEFFCPICCCLLWKSRSCAACQNLFCNRCIRTWLNANSITCPLCRSLYEEKLAPPSIQSILSYFSIHCRNTPLGCTEILSYDLLEQHESIDCNFLTKKCRVCEQIVLVTGIDQHKTICKPIVKQCSLCQCFVKIDLFERHQDECLEKRSNAYEELFLPLDSPTVTILSTTTEVVLIGIEMFNQTRQKNCLVRFWTMVQLILANLPMIHLILFNLFKWGCENLAHALFISLVYPQTWIRTSMYQSLIFTVIFSFILNYSLSFLLASVNDTFIILFIIFSLIIWSSISPEIQVNQFQMNFDFKEMLLFSISIFLLFQIPLFIIRSYFQYIPINIGAVLASGMIWYSNYF